MIYNNLSVSVVVPAYNEEEYIAYTVQSLEKVLVNIVSDFEIIVVNDKSTDATVSILQELQKSRPYLTIVNNRRNMGLGATLRAGFARARCDTIFYVDADMPFDFYDLAKALRVMSYRKADIIAGFRLDRTSEGVRRIIYSFAYNFMIRLLFGVKMKDINFSFKLIKKSALKRLKLNSSGSFIDAEIIIKASRAGMPIYQIGTDYYPREYGQSTLSGMNTILGIIREMGVFYFAPLTSRLIKLNPKPYVVAIFRAFNLRRIGLLLSR